MRKTILLVATLLLFAAPVQAEIIFPGGEPDYYGSMNVTWGLTADDFSVGIDSTLTDVHFWTMEYEPAGAGNPWDGTLDYYIYGDGGGEPGTVIDSGSGQNVVKTATGSQWPPNPVLKEYTYSFDLQNPLDLSAGDTYWLGLHLASGWPEANQVFWESTDSEFGSYAHFLQEGVGDWSDHTMHAAFYLTGEPVPEPATVLLLGIGLVGLVGFRKKFKK